MGTKCRAGGSTIRPLQPTLANYRAICSIVEACASIGLEAELCTFCRRMHLSMLHIAPFNGHRHKWAAEAAEARPIRGTKLQVDVHGRPVNQASAEAAGRSLPALQQPGALCFQRVPDVQDALLARQVGVRGIQGTAERPGRASS